MHVIQAPTPLPPANITVLSAAHLTSDSYLISHSTNLQLRANSLQHVGMYNWSTSNSSISSCLTTVQAYLTLSSTCLQPGARYLLRLMLTMANGGHAAGQVTALTASDNHRSHVMIQSKPLGTQNWVWICDA